MDSRSLTDRSLLIVRDRSGLKKLSSSATGQLRFELTQQRCASGQLIIGGEELAPGQIELPFSDMVPNVHQQTHGAREFEMRLLSARRGDDGTHPSSALLGSIVHAINELFVGDLAQTSGFGGVHDVLISQGQNRLRKLGHVLASYTDPL